MNSLKKYHNAGQKVGSTGTWKNPHSLVRELTTWSDADKKQLRSEQKAYNKGFNNGWKTTH